MSNDTTSCIPPRCTTLLVLFLGGILAYGGSVAWSILSRFDLVNLVDNQVNLDDAYYYFQIARNLAEGKISTFDGIIRTNGYHPFWMLIITPFYWIFDPETALFGIKVFEITLVTGSVVLVVLAAAFARLPWILLFAVCPVLFNNRSLTVGTEAAAGLFMLAALLLGLVLFARNKMIVAAIVFVLPWIRLEYVAISATVTAVLYFIQYSKQRNNMKGSVAVFDRILSSFILLKETVSFAVAGILTYFLYNGVVFGGIVPVSGAVKHSHSKNLWEGVEYNFLQNFQDILQQIEVGPSDCLVALEIATYTLAVCLFGHCSQSRGQSSFLNFLLGISSLGVCTLAQVTLMALTMHPEVVEYSGWYYVPAYLMRSLIIPVRCYVIIYFIHRLILPKSRSVASVASVSILVIGMIVSWSKAPFTEPFSFIDQRVSASLNKEPNAWNLSAYAGVQTMNRVLPEGTIIGSYDAGVIGYFSRFPVINLDGLVNSYEYLRSTDRASFIRSFGVTYLANALPVKERFRGGSGKALFEGMGFSSGRDYEFKFGSRFSHEHSPSGTDPVAWFWKRIEPYFDYQSESGDVGVVIDGRLVTSFSKYCTADEEQDRYLMLQWMTKEGEVGMDIGRPSTNAGEMPWVCGDASLLPSDTILPIRIAQIADDGEMLGSFENRLDNWLLDGNAVTVYGQHERTVEQQPITGYVGEGFLTTYSPNSGDAATGTARSPKFTISDPSVLTLLIAGGCGDRVGVRLLADGAEVEVWRGKCTEHFEIVFHSLAGLEGKTLSLEMFDYGTGDWDHIMVDHVRLLQMKT